MAIKGIAMKCDWCEKEESFEDEDDLAENGEEWWTVRRGGEGWQEEKTFCCQACLEAWL